MCIPGSGARWGPFWRRASTAVLNKTDSRLELTVWAERIEEDKSLYKGIISDRGKHNDKNKQDDKLEQGSANYGHWPNLTCCRLLSIKFYWNSAMPIHLHTVYGCLHSVTADLSSCNRDHLACNASSI